MIQEKILNNGIRQTYQERRRKTGTDGEKRWRENGGDREKRVKSNLELKVLDNTSFLS